MFSEEDIAEYGDLWSLMYCVFAQEMVDSFGEEGKKAVIRAVKKYGEARGIRLKNRHKQMGLPINLRSLMTHYDLPGHPGTVKERTSFTDDKLVSFTYTCPFEQNWRDRNCIGVGLLYCQYFHHAMWQAYRPDLDVQLPEILTNDDPHCKFIVTQPK